MLPSTLKQAALWYGEAGIPVFPCRPFEKAPITVNGFKDASTDLQQIERWWNAVPNANLAIPTEKLVVVDVDGADNPWLRDQPHRLADLATTINTRTPRGGRQYFFRQPDGKAWGCTVSSLAPNVDTRAIGGYVLLPPSVYLGREYQWEDERGLASISSLLEPPTWLAEMLDTATGRTSTPLVLSNLIPAGFRNNTLTRLAGVMRRVGMSQTEIAASLHKANHDRCQPPLPDKEVDDIASSIASYEPSSVAVALVENHFKQDFTEVPPPLDVLALVKQCPELRAPVIDGLLRTGETLNVIAPPKTGKSWLVLGLVMSVATGRPWLGTYKTTRGRVLIMDNELHPQTLSNRIPTVATGLGVTLDELSTWLSIYTLRGQLRDIYALKPYFDAMQPGEYSVIVLDAFYRFMPKDMDENDNGTMAEIYNFLDSIADRLGCCFVLIHHTSKGSQANKSITDMGAGAGSQSRATDSHLVLRPHEEEGVVVLEAAVRSWPKVKPMAMRFVWPVWLPAPEVDPTKLRPEKPKKTEEEKITVETYVATFVTETPKLRQVILTEATDARLSAWRATELLRQAEAKKLVHRWPSDCRQAAFATIAPPQAHPSSESQ